MAPSWWNWKSIKWSICCPIGRPKRSSRGGSAHPGIQIISRDRAGSYADAARRGAPQALQVSDRFHLLLNLQTAVVRLFDRKHDLLKRLQTEEHASPDSRAEMVGPSLSQARPLPLKQVQRQARRARRKTRYEEVLKLHEQGASQKAIASLLGLHRDTCRRYLAAPAFPDIVRPKRKSLLDPYKGYLHQRWAAGQHNITHLLTEIRARGYRGSATIVHDYLRPFRKHPEWLEVSQQQYQPTRRWE